MQSTTAVGAALVAAVLLGCRPVAASGETADVVISGVSHIAGIAGVPRGKSGELVLAGDELVFRQKKGPDVRVQLRRVDGIEFALAGREYTAAAIGAAAATPFGLGGLLMAKKHQVDLLVCNYRNDAGGAMGLVLQLPKGAADRSRRWLEERGVPVQEPPLAKIRR